MAAVVGSCSWLHTYTYGHTLNQTLLTLDQRPSALRCEAQQLLCIMLDARGQGEVEVGARVPRLWRVGLQLADHFGVVDQLQFQGGN